MMVSNEGSVYGLLRWQQRRTYLFVGAAAFVWVADSAFGWHFLEINALPLSILGAAIGIFASFRTNSAYDRWWEGRKLWGRLINTSRHWCSQALHYVGRVDPEAGEALVRRHVAYVHVLKALLRQQDPFADEDIQRWMTPEDAETHREATNLTHALLHEQMAVVAAMHADGKIDGHAFERMDATLYDLLNIQGGCERIKGTPLPRGYAFVVDTLIDVFGVVFPLAIVHELGWVTIPVNLVVGMSLTMISETGRVLEDPFNMFWNALPLQNLARKIERNLAERLGDETLQPAVVPDNNGILM